MSYKVLSYDRRHRVNQLDLPKDYNSDNENSIYKLSPKNFESFELDIKTLKLPVTQKKTNFLKQVFCRKGIVISEKVKEILLEFNLPKNRMFPITIEQGEEKSKYNLLYTNFDILDHVNYNESIFYKKNGFQETSNIKILNKKEYFRVIEMCREVRSKESELMDSIGMPIPGIQEKIIEFKRNSIYYFGYTHLVLSQNIVESFDLINDFSNFYVSSRLRKKLEVNDIKGLVFKDPSRISLS